MLVMERAQADQSMSRSWTGDLRALHACAQIESLRRFMPQLLHIRQPGAAAAAPGAPNVGSAASLIEVFQS